MQNIRFLAAVVLLSIGFSVPAAPAAAEDQRPNILFIAVDDLKPLTGAYGDPVAITPSLDTLAEQSTVFHRAYVQYPVCGPSRTSMLTGLRPETNGVLDLKTRMRDVHPDIVTMPQLFKNAGYETAAVGKIFDPRNVDSRQDDDPASWSIPFKMVSGKVDNRTEPNFVAKSIDARSDQFIDGRINNRGIELLRRMAAGDKPFFLGVGYKKPHLPFIVPKRFFDLYERDSFDLAPFQSAPEHSDASYVLSGNNELRTYWPAPSGSAEAGPYGDAITEPQQRELLHGYYAAVSFIDSLVAELLAALEETGKSDNTIIVLWGDHGFHLGDHSVWGKHTTMEQAARHPLMIRAPGMPAGAADALVEALDIFPTLIELAGLTPPSGLQGKSLAPILVDKTTVIKDAAITQYRRKGAFGYSMRTDRYRYTEWVSPTGEVAYRDLYDLAEDPGETVNIADRDESAELVDDLARQLRANGNGLLWLQP
jgi:arylsulfatase A-like enzyme